MTYTNRPVFVELAQWFLGLALGTGLGGRHVVGFLVEGRKKAHSGWAGMFYVEQWGPVRCWPADHVCAVCVKKPPRGRCGCCSIKHPTGLQLSPPRSRSRLARGLVEAPTQEGCPFKGFGAGNLRLAPLSTTRRILLCGSVRFAILCCVPGGLSPAWRPLWVSQSRFRKSLDDGVVPNQHRAGFTDGIAHLGCQFLGHFLVVELAVDDAQRQRRFAVAGADAQAHDKDA